MARPRHQHITNLEAGSLASGVGGDLLDDDALLRHIRDLGNRMTPGNNTQTQADEDTRCTTPRLRHSGLLMRRTPTTNCLEGAELYLNSASHVMRCLLKRRNIGPQKHLE
ncbi:MAG: hypothetical protein LC753_14540 [Acidobacteria bacterium]|nr:hypothetical protein [Acidobacteriota bacterium]